MKIGIFTDAHYSSQDITCGNRRNSRSLLKIRQAYSFFETQKCELILCLGDLIDRECSHSKEIENLREVAKVIRQFDIPSICLMGNHDAFAFEAAEFYTILGGCVPEDRRIDGKKLLFLDACYFKSGKHYSVGDTDWTDTYFPNAADLESRLADTVGDTYLFLHQNLDPAVPQNHRLFNADRIRDIAQNSGVVKAVYQGHYHAGKISEYNGVAYITLPAMCENEIPHCLHVLEI
ncbi:MAG: metallophosphoesterase family protein [Acutalibacteraceae bacterium]